MKLKMESETNLRLAASVEEVKERHLTSSVEVDACALTRAERDLSRGER
jgi:hypothetical protein